MPSVDATRRSTNQAHFDLISPLSMGFPVDIETPERRRFRKEQEELKKHITADLSSSYRPTAAGIHQHIIWPHATMKGFLTKHLPPSPMLSLVTKHRKRRYVILADRFLYCFKTDTPTHKYRDYMELRRDTQVFVTDHLAGVLYCIEIRNTGTTWFLQADHADSMKVWLERLKKTIHYLADTDNEGPITKDKLHLVHSPEDVFIMNGGGIDTDSSSSSSSLTYSPRSSQHDIYGDTGTSIGPMSPGLYRSHRNSSARSSLSNEDHRIKSLLPDVLPPQLPPPTSKLPPPPPSYL
ncbi:hypothetical protein BC941DRAFT_417348 [Chlamydoabsidia padenii]|nr:hypothetical protein BC941DRAFT_417348 [Chlamydoabsidia padenii]